MQLLKNMPIKRKVTLVILSTCVTALLVTGGALLASRIISFRQDFTRSLSALGQITARHSSGAVAFKDKQAATETLDALKIKSHIVHARIRLKDGSVLAEYGAPNAFPETLKAQAKRGLQFEGDYLVFREGIILDGEEIGLLCVYSDYAKELHSLVKLYVGTLLLVLSGSAFVAFLLSARLQRFISAPILSLAKTARVIAEKKDYSVRAEKEAQDEIGLFTDAFNQMLDQIQKQDVALRAAHQQKFESLVNSIDGIVWEAEPATLRFSFVSQHAERLLGYPASQWLAEDSFWEDHVDPADRKQTLEAMRKGIAACKPFALEFRMLAADGREVWVRNNATVVTADGAPSLLRGVMLDISERRTAEQKLEELHKQLVGASRQAGMAEVATGVLHNVGNVLNSVNVSASLLHDRTLHSKSLNLTKIAALLTEHSADMAAFLATDPKGKVLPSYVVSLSGMLAEERDQVLSEVTLLTKNVQHIKDIVAMQQSYAKVSGMVETLEVADLVEDAIQMNEGAFSRHAIQVTRRFAPVPPVAVDKHKALQILVNLLRNAKHSLQECGREERCLSVEISANGEKHVNITVRDNGLGIPPENLTRIFAHGFTTKRQGHGFGLHSGALAAKEMKGSLTAASDGLGKGASFRLSLPIAIKKADA